MVFNINSSLFFSILLYFFVFHYIIFNFELYFMITWFYKSIGHYRNSADFLDVIGLYIYIYNAIDYYTVLKFRINRPHSALNALKY